MGCCRPTRRTEGHPHGEVWVVRTDMGGPDARLGIADSSIPNLAGTIEAQTGNPGLRCLSPIPTQAACVAPVETADRSGDFARRFCAAIRIDMKRMPATSTTKVTIQNTSCMPAGRAS